MRSETVTVTVRGAAPEVPKTLYILLGAGAIVLIAVILARR